MNADVLAEAQGIVTSGALQVWDVIGNFIALIGISLFLFLFAYRIGKGPFVSLIMSLYVGYAVFVVFPFADQILRGIGNSPGIVAGSLIGLYIFASAIPYIIIRKIAASDFIRLSTFSLIILSVLTAGFIIALGHNALSVSNFYTLPSPLSQIFIPPQYFFWWFIAPLAGLLIFTRR